MQKRFKFSFVALLTLLFLSGFVFRQAEQKKTRHLEALPLDTAGMVLVKGGTFMMGSYQFSNERPVHEVVISDFYIGKYEVTVAEYQKYCSETGAEMPPPPSWGWKPERPMVNVTYRDAQKYAKWAGKRLPTEAEWEYAAKGGEKTHNYRYSGSNLPAAVGWSFENSLNQAQPVGTKRANELGIHDMSGNVWEWCQDFFGTYQPDRVEDPQGPESGINRVLRGGSWFDKASNLRVANRYYAGEGHKDVLTGFRLAMDAPKTAATEGE